MTGRVAPALRVTGLRVTFGGETSRDAPGLTGVTLEVAAGERLVLVGASGAGKTTLLRAVAGLVPIDEGSIEIGGKDVTRLPPEGRGAVYLHQTPVLFPHLTVEENVAFPLRIRGVPRGEARKRVHEVLDAVRLAELGHRPSGALSGGQRHRVALARAVVARPSLLLLDEPLSSLDPGLRHEIRDVIVHLQAQSQAHGPAQSQAHGPAQGQAGLLLVTHDLEEAGLLGHRVGIVMGGGLAQLAPPEAIFRAPATLEVARFLGYRNEFSCPPESALEARLFGGSHVSNGHSSDSQAGEARTAPKAGGGGSVVVLPPGSIRVVPATSAQALTKGMAGGPWIRLSGRLRHLVHPGPRPLARVEVDLPDAGPVVLEAEMDPAAAGGTGTPEGSPAPGSPVGVLVDASRVLRF